jgi:hypothetical protein
VRHPAVALDGTSHTPAGQSATPTHGAPAHSLPSISRGAISPSELQPIDAQNRGFVGDSRRWASHSVPSLATAVAQSDDHLRPWRVW